MGEGEEKSGKRGLGDGGRDACRSGLANGLGRTGEGRKKRTAEYAEYAEGTLTDRNVCSARRRTKHAGRARSPDAKHNLPSDGRGGREGRDAGAWAGEQKMNVERQSAVTRPGWI